MIYAHRPSNANLFFQSLTILGVGTASVFLFGSLYSITYYFIILFLVLAAELSQVVPVSFTSAVFYGALFSVVATVISLNVAALWLVYKKVTNLKLIVISIAGILGVLVPIISVPWVIIFQ